MQPSDINPNKVFECSESGALGLLECLIVKGYGFG
jgi:hypothetical protein